MSNIVRGVKTLTNTAASLFAEESELSGRTWMRVRNLDWIVPVIVDGRTLEAGESITLSFSSSSTDTVTVEGYSVGRSVQVEVLEYAG